MERPFQNIFFCSFSKKCSNFGHNFIEKSKNDVFSRGFQLLSSTANKTLCEETNMRVDKGFSSMGIADICAILGQKRYQIGGGHILPGADKWF